MPIANDVERALRGRAGKEGTVGEGLNGVDLRIVEGDEFSGGVGGERWVVGDLENLSVRPSAHEELCGVIGGLDAPEEISGSGHDEFGENGARDEPAIGTGGEALETAARDIAEEIDVGFLRQWIRVKSGGGHATRQADEH